MVTENREVEPKSGWVIWLNILCFGLFTSVALAHSYLNTQISKEYETQMSVQQSFELIRSNIVDTTELNLDQFWVWIYEMRINLFVCEEESLLYRMKDSPDYLVTDFHITTRRINEVSSSKYTDDLKWITTSFRPFVDEFNAEFEATTPFQIG